MGSNKTLTCFNFENKKFTQLPVTDNTKDQQTISTRSAHSSLVTLFPGHQIDILAVPGASLEKSSRSGPFSSSETLQALGCSDSISPDKDVDFSKKKTNTSCHRFRNLLYPWREPSQKFSTEKKPPTMSKALESTNREQDFSSPQISFGVGELPKVIFTPGHQRSFQSPKTDGSVYSDTIRLDENDMSYKVSPVLWSLPREGALGVKKNIFSFDSDDITTWTDDLPSSSARSSTYSLCTSFEENDSPSLPRITLSASSSKAQFNGNLRIDTTASRRSSKGWWNYILSPFISTSDLLAVHDKDDFNSSPDFLARTATEGRSVASREIDIWKNSTYQTASEKSQRSRSHLEWYLDTKVKNVDGKVALIQGMRRNHRTASIVASICGLSQAESVDANNFLSDPEVISSDLNPLQAEMETSTYMEQNAERMDVVNNNDRRNIKDIQPESHWNFRQVTKKKLSRSIFKPKLDNKFSSNKPLSKPYLFSSQKKSPQYSGYHNKSLPSQASISESQSRTPQMPITSSGEDVSISNLPLTPLKQDLANPYSKYYETPAISNGGNFLNNFPQHTNIPNRNKSHVTRKNRKYSQANECINFWGCVPNSRHTLSSEAKRRNKWKWKWCLTVVILVFCLVTLISLLSFKLHKKSETKLPQAQWLNLTGFPPVYLGFSTVISPSLIRQNSACIFPATLWSCDLPKELQSSVRGRPSKQPNLFMQIDWDNSTRTNYTLSYLTKDRMKKPEARDHIIFRRNHLGLPIISARQSIDFVSDPLPPPIAEESFMGRTTDGIVSAQKAGESTPFYVSFLQSSKLLVSRMRADKIKNSFPNISSIIPQPSIEPDGTMAPANLLPFPIYQPIRLYDRGLPTEHYGFYNYFDRSIFLQSTTLNESDPGNGLSRNDLDGGATREMASFRCTWSQTRFLIQIWTRKNGSTRLNHFVGDTVENASEANLQKPGTFPYPLTITIDRHGGDALTKTLYCYAMNDQRKPIADSGKISSEDRGFGGELINPAPSLFKNDSDPNLGGFDGGNSGCLCQWSNFEETMSIEKGETN